MAHQFTAAAERAIAAASCWSRGDEPDVLEPHELLLGLLAEPESRASGMLAARGIDPAQVRKRWPNLKPRETADGRGALRLSPAVEASLGAAAQRLRDYPRPLVLATEHVLLGLVAAEHELASWLGQHGLTADALEAEIHRLYGFEPAAVPLDVPATVSAGDGPRDILGPCQPAPVWRILDAAANRAREGLRVVEDYVRFVLDDRHLTGQLKQLRHDLAAALTPFPAVDRLAARETLADVGTGVSTTAERARQDLTGVLAANFKRIEESLRSLEEYGKLVDPAAGAAFETLRYRAYTLERVVDITRASGERLANTRLCVVLDGGRTREEFRSLAESLLRAGVHMLQLRDKSLSDRQLVDRARLLRSLSRGTDTLVIVNDRPDLAALVEADGVHVGQEELAVKDARAMVGARALVGASTHSLAEARQAVLDGANYIGVGPTFPSYTKHFEPGEFTGVELLRAVTSQIRLPVFAIGGIDRQNVPDVLAAGCRRVAVSAAVVAARDPAAAARELLALLERS